MVQSVKIFNKWVYRCAFISMMGSINVALAEDLPNVKILATGGTIAGAGVSSTQYAGYQAAVTPVDKLLQNVPEINKVAHVTGEQIAQVASQDMDNETLLKIGKRVNSLLARSDVDGLVITHGTNTLEETAYFLNLVVKSSKPVVLVGAMRPGTSMSADGPMNLFRAVVTAGSQNATAKGVMVVMNDQIIAARDLVKSDTMTVDTFKAPIFGYLGYVVDDKAYFYKGAARKHTHQSEFDISQLSSLPRVDIVYGYQSDSPVALNALVKDGAQAVVHAGSGTAAISKNMEPGIVNAVKSGVAIVRSPRTSLGIITRNMEFDDDKFGTIAGDTLNPPKARILLMLGLTKTRNAKELQRIFNTY